MQIGGTCIHVSQVTFIVYGTCNESTNECYENNGRLSEFLEGFDRIQCYKEIMNIMNKNPVN